jgi:hypothetical protein
MAIRLVRIFTGDDGQSHFSVGEIEWNETEALNAISKSEQARPSPSKRPPQVPASTGTMLCIATM